MIQEFKTHKVAYSVLAFVLFGFVLTFLHVWPDRTLQRATAVGMGVFYFIWGVVVHIKHRHINSRIILEYLAVSILAVSLLLLLLS